MFSQTKVEIDRDALLAAAVLQRVTETFMRGRYRGDTQPSQEAIQGLVDRTLRELDAEHIRGRVLAALT